MDEQRLRNLKKAIKRWEIAFRADHKRKPEKKDIKADFAIYSKYREYYHIKQSSQSAHANVPKEKDIHSNKHAINNDSTDKEGKLAAEQDEKAEKGCKTPPYCGAADGISGENEQTEIVNNIHWSPLLVTPSRDLSFLLSYYHTQEDSIDESSNNPQEQIVYENGNPAENSQVDNQSHLNGNLVDLDHYAMEDEFNLSDITNERSSTDFESESDINFSEESQDEENDSSNSGFDQELSSYSDIGTEGMDDSLMTIGMGSETEPEISLNLFSAWSRKRKRAPVSLPANYFVVASSRDKRAHANKKSDASSVLDNNQFKPLHIGRTPVLLDDCVSNIREDKDLVTLTAAEKIMKQKQMEQMKKKKNRFLRAVEQPNEDPAPGGFTWSKQGSFGGAKRNNFKKLNLRGQKKNWSQPFKNRGVPGRVDIDEEYQIMGAGEMPKESALIRPAYDDQENIENNLETNGKTIEFDNALCDVLLSTFGITEFREGQKETIKRVLEGKSTLFIAPTGSGKSLCYQIPAVLSPKGTVALIISPLLSLMFDQLSQLPKNLSGACLCSTQSAESSNRVMELLKSKKLNILFISPERLLSETFLDACLDPEHGPVFSFACIDEAHCVSEWSHNFRPSYLQLSYKLKDVLGIKTILALTATSSVQVSKSICDVLQINSNDGVIQFDPIRPNLELTASNDKDKLYALKSLLQSGYLEKPIIIYCGTRKETEIVAGDLRNSNVKHLQGSEVDFYHAGRDADTLKAVQNKFFANELKIVVATVAFGLGINKKDIRAVIHYSIPRTVESYVQEIGRAGRDGKPARCHLFLDNQDYVVQRALCFADGVELITMKQFVQKIYSISEAKSKKKGNEQNMAKYISIPAQDGDCVHHQAIDVKPVVRETLLTILSTMEGSGIQLLASDQPSSVCFKQYVSWDTISKYFPTFADAFDKVAKSKTSNGNVIFDICDFTNCLNGGVVSEDPNWDLPKVYESFTMLASLKDDHEKNFADIEFQGEASILYVDPQLKTTNINDIISALHKKTDAMEKLAVTRCDEMYRIAKLSSFAKWKDAFESSKNDLEQERDLNHQISLYFQQTPSNFESSNTVTVESPIKYTIPNDNTLKNFVRELYRQKIYNSRVIARLLMGLGSPNFPSEEHHRKFYWRRYEDYDFFSLQKEIEKCLREIITGSRS